MELKQDLRGIISSLHTPFTDKDQIDVASLQRLIAHCADAGCSGVLVTAVAGEVAALSIEESRLLLEVTTKSAGPDLTVVAGISAETVSESLVLAKNAAEFSVPVLMWQPPANLDEAKLIDALHRIADVGDHQIMMQDLDWAGPGIPAETIVRAADQVPALTAVKVETVPAGPKYSAVAKLSEGRLHLSGGWAVLQMLDGLTRGLDAFIPSGMLSHLVAVFDAWEQGDQQEARRIFEMLLPIQVFSNQHIDVSRRFWKYVRVQQGIFETDHCRLSGPLDKVQMQEAERLCRQVLQMEAR